eukprot:scaffold15394_cov111-Isochrysis_galbana.AAC.9
MPSYLTASLSPRAAARPVPATTSSHLSPLGCSTIPLGGAATRPAGGGEAWPTKAAVPPDTDAVAGAASPLLVGAGAPGAGAASRWSPASAFAGCAVARVAFFDWLRSSCRARRSLENWPIRWTAETPSAASAHRPSNQLNSMHSGREAEA